MFLYFQMMHFTLSNSGMTERAADDFLVEEFADANTSQENVRNRYVLREYIMWPNANNWGTLRRKCVKRSKFVKIVNIHLNDLGTINYEIHN